MAHPILMPKPGQMTEECTVVAWHKQVGDAVHRGDVLFEIETDKSNMDVEAFDEGVLLRTYVEVGQTVPVNSVCAYVGDAGETVPDEPPAVLVPDREGDQLDAAGPVDAAEPARAAPAAVSAPAAPAAPAAVAAAVAPAALTTPAARIGSGDEERADRIRISPRASRLAAGSGVDPRSITGTGPGGRITERDVRESLASTPQQPAAVPALAVLPVSAPAGQPGDDEEGPRPMSRMRRVIAERLTLSATTIPHFTVTVAVDVTRLVGLRAELKAAGTSLSVTDFVLAATAQTLAEFPDVNSRTDGVSVWVRKRVHLGLAVSVPNGLVVPVIRDADRCTLAELHDRAAALANAARAGSLSPDEMTGSTFTVSNLGMFGVDEFNAIINPGESAILAVSSVTPTPVVVGEGLAVRQVMKLTLSADHRVVDGELAARFLNAVRRRLSDVEAFRTDALNS